MGHRDALLSAMSNTTADLDANRAGRLGPEQSRRLLRSAWSNLAGAVFIGVALAAILAFVADRPLKPVQYIVAAVLFGAALATGLVYFNRVRAAVAEGRVECLAGAAREYAVRKAGWYLEAGGRHFRLPLRPGHVQNGRSYRVYVAPPSNVVVALEPEGWD